MRDSHPSSRDVVGASIGLSQYGTVACWDVCPAGGVVVPYFVRVTHHPPICVSVLISLCSQPLFPSRSPSRSSSPCPVLAVLPHTTWTLLLSTPEVRSDPAARQDDSRYRMERSVEGANSARSIHEIGSQRSEKCEKWQCSDARGAR